MRRTKSVLNKLQVDWLFGIFVYVPAPPSPLPRPPVYLHIKPNTPPSHKTQKFLYVFLIAIWSLFKAFEESQ